MSSEIQCHCITLKAHEEKLSKTRPVGVSQHKYAQNNKHVDILAQLIIEVLYYLSYLFLKNYVTSGGAVSHNVLNYMNSSPLLITKEVDMLVFWFVWVFTIKGPVPLMEKEVEAKLLCKINEACLHT